MKRLIILLLCCTSLYAIDIQKFGLSVPEKYRNAISSGQGLREMILLEEENVTMEGRFHNGIDFAVPTGTDVYAAKDGIVIVSYPGKYNSSKFKGYPVYGSMILIEHFDGTYSLYAHLLGVLIKEGQEVKKGEHIAYSGGDRNSKPTGLSTNSHLHFSVYLKLSEVIDFGN